MSDLKLKNMEAWIHWKRVETPPMHENDVGFVNDIEGLIARLRSAEEALRFYAEVVDGRRAQAHFDQMKEKK